MLPRWFHVLVLAAAIALGASEARAQVFRPRTGKAAVVSKAAPAPAAPATGKKSPVAAVPAASSRNPARASATTPRRAGTAAKKKRGKPRGDSDVTIDDDDDVKITDD